MLAIFQKTFAHPPEELNSPASNLSGKTPKLPGETLSDFLSTHPDSAFSMNFSDSAVLAFVRPENSHRPRMFSGIDGIYCVFLGTLNNLCDLNKQYGLSGKSSNEAMFVIEAYRTLRDRGPYPADQVLRGLDGSFAFVVYDAQTSSVFAALGSDGAESLYWGIAADGSVVMSDDIKIIKQGCAKSFAPFPTGEVKSEEVEWERFLMEAQQPILLTLTSSLCGVPCDVVEEQVTQLGKTYGDRIIFYKADILEKPFFTRLYKVVNVPTLIVFKGGKEIKRLESGFYWGAVHDLLFSENIFYTAESESESESPSPSPSPTGLK